MFPNLDAVGGTLTSLNLKYNKIQNIPSERLGALTKLSALDLSNNNLNELPDFSGPSHSLTYLNMNENPIEWVGFTEMQALEGITATVSLRNTKISFLPSVCLDMTTSLDLAAGVFDLCYCSNSWVKQEMENGTLVLHGVNMDVVCDGADETWAELTAQQFKQVCKPLNETACDKGT